MSCRGTGSTQVVNANDCTRLMIDLPGTLSTGSYDDIPVHDLLAFHHATARCDALMVRESREFYVDSSRTAVHTSTSSA